jgi:hypothetical protein
MEVKKKWWQELGGLEGVFELLAAIGLVSASAVIAFLGKVVFAGVLLLIAFGVFLRFKRRKTLKR